MAEEIWIEGVGSLGGFPGTMLIDCVRYALLCSFMDEELVWHDPYQGQCFYTNWDWDGTGDNIEKKSISAFPNPASEKVTIDGFKPTEVQVYNALGQKVKTV